MDSKEDVELLEKLVGQLQSLYAEIGALSKKSPNDAVNPFKLKLINKVLKMGNDVLGENYKPFEEFDQFDGDDAPSTSDVTMVISQYMEEAERFRSDNVKQEHGAWYYLFQGELSDIRSGPPTKIGRKR
ncbi:hypothetical protein [Thalassospira alkalitolerans]|uniref:hypothetical protein n=1 Tax=Thalassospira alkalitolerans TaxID=1293890 RepID=UPI003AA7F7ED